MATYQRGVATTVTGWTDFLYQSLSTSTKGDKAEAPDSSGNVAAFDLYNTQVELKVEAIFPVGGSLPSREDTITCGGVLYTVESIEVTEQNKDYRKCSITAIRYTTNSLPAAGSGS